MNEKIIDNKSLSEWREIFTKVLDVESDWYDIVFAIYPNLSAEMAVVEEEDEELACDIFNEKADLVYDAFKEVFGYHYPI